MIRFEAVSRRYGDWTAVDQLTLTVQQGELLVLIGPSGSGKSTLLKMVNRLIEPTSGVIRLHGEDIATLRPELLRRRVGYAIQSVGLFPHWTVERNIATVPTLLGWSRAAIRDRVTELLELFHLDPNRFRRVYPHQLSGGQAQRVGVARALAGDPEVLLMDEPFAALDPITRARLQAEMLRIQRQLGKTILFVTHDMDEALRLGARIAVLDHGRLLRVAAPAEIIRQPGHPLVAELLGGERLGLRRLAFETVATRLRAGEQAEGEPIPTSASLGEALNRMLARGVDRLPVADAEARLIGAVDIADILRPSEIGAAL
jgi:osmoprotectant transport system ATP-binding protein